MEPVYLAQADEMLPDLIQTESGGDPGAVSPKGAFGVGQAMPATAANPGYGVRPMQNRSVSEQRRFARDYLAAMLERYGGDPIRAAAAYNAGPGKVDKAGGVPNIAETQNYVRKVGLPHSKGVTAAEIGLDDLQDMPGQSAPQGVTAAEIGLDDIDPPTRTESDQWKHAAGVAGRAALEGISAVPGQLLEIAGLPLNAAGVTEWGDADTGKYGKMAADYLGLPQPNDDQKALFNVGKTAYSAMTPGVIAKGIGNVPAALKYIGADAPFQMAISAGAGQGAAEGVKAAGGGEGAQTLAAVLGNLGTGGVMGMTPRIAEGGKRLIQAGAGSMEPIAGRVLNRMTAGLGQDEIAALVERQMVEDLLRKGELPGADVPGFNPRSSAIAGNAGVSRLMDFVQNNPVAATDLTKRNIANQEAIQSLAQKAVGGEGYAANKSASLKQMRDEVANPMRLRDVLVNLDPAREQIDIALSRNVGNPAVTSALEKIKQQIPEDGAGFNSVYNFKQYIDDALRGKYADPDSQSIQKAGYALGDLRTTLANVLNESEPAFKDYLKKQAVGIDKLNRREAASEIVRKAKSSVPQVYNDPAIGQIENFPFTPTGLQRQLSNPEIRAQLSPAQLRILDRANKAALAGTRLRAGEGGNSATYQRFRLEKSLEDDIMRGFTGGDLGKGSSLSKVLGLGVFQDLASKIGRVDDLAAVLARAELDPEYAAELMKKGKLSFGKNPRAIVRRSLVQPAFNANSNQE